MCVTCRYCPLPFIKREVSRGVNQIKEYRRILQTLDEIEMLINQTHSFDKRMAYREKRVLLKHLLEKNKVYKVVAKLGVDKG